MEKKRTLVVAVILIALVSAATIIIVQYPGALDEIFHKTQRPDLQILSRDCTVGRNDSVLNGVNASFTVAIKNTGATNQSKTLVCSVSYKIGSGDALKFDNRTLVSLVPGETRTYHAFIVLPSEAKSVDWNVDTVFVD